MTQSFFYFIIKYVEQWSKNIDTISAITILERLKYSEFILWIEKNSIDKLSLSDIQRFRGKTINDVVLFVKGKGPTPTLAMLLWHMKILYSLRLRNYDGKGEIVFYNEEKEIVINSELEVWLRMNNSENSIKLFPK